MGPKQKSAGAGRGGAGKQKSASAADQVEETLQAVVLADTFETRFEPFTLEKPRCLLPLANTPLIEYTLEFLANAGVEEVFLYAGAHSDQLEKYITASKWRTPSSPFKQLVFLKSTSTSVGDVMRDLEGKHLITGDFIVVSGDVISNLPIEGALVKHRARRQADKNAIMTMILREAGTRHRTKASSASPVFFIDPTRDRCLHYEEIDEQPQFRQQDEPPPAHHHHVTIDAEILSSHPELDIRQDLIDCNIDICTPDVLGLWSDSFDYQTPRKQFLFGVLKDYELNGKTVHTHIVRDHYAARVRNLKAYDAVSRDVVSRWAYPLCPDTNLLPGHSYDLHAGYQYREHEVTLARSCVVGRCTVIGHGTSIGDKSVVTNSVLGRNCKIGRNVILDGAYLWDNVTVHDGSVVRHAIIADDAVVGHNCTVEPGALLSYAVKIADGVTVRQGLRITTCSDSADAPSDAAVVGHGGQGYEYVRDEDDEDEEDNRSVASSGLVYTARRSFSNESISTLSSDVSDGGYFAGSRSESFGTSYSDDEDQSHFHHDAAASVFDSLRDGVSADVVQLELVSLRMTANASDHQVRRAVVLAFMKRIQQLMDGGASTSTSTSTSTSNTTCAGAATGISAGDAVHEVFSKYREVVDRCLFDRNIETKSDQVDLLLLIQQDLVHRTRGDTVLLFTAKELYDLELVEEEAFEQWWADERSSSSEEMRLVRRQTQQFVDWLADAEEEDEDEDDEEDDEEDD